MPFRKGYSIDKIFCPDITKFVAAAYPGPASRLMLERAPLIMKGDRSKIYDAGLSTVSAPKDERG